MKANVLTQELPVQNAGQVSKHIFLTGRPPIGEYIGFVKGMAVDGQFLNQGQLVEDWRKGNSRILELEKAEEGVANNPIMNPIPENLKALEREVLTSSIFHSNFGSFPTKLAMVRLEQLVVYQKFINLAFVDSIINRLSEKPTNEEIFRLVLGLSRLDPPVKSMRTGQNVFTFMSPSNDFRFLDVVPVASEQIPSEMLNGFPSNVFALVLGYGSNCLNAINIGNRLILNNGSHRAYALYKLGIKEVPCIVQQISTKDELELIGNQDLIRNLDRYTTNPRPPMLKDYFDEQLIKIVPVQSKNRMVRLQFGVEQVDVPAT